MSEFTNRHGKKIRVSDDAVAAETTAPAKKISSASATGPKRTFRMPKIRLSKRLVIILGLVLIIGAVATLVMADRVKRDYEQQTALMKRTVTERSHQSNSSDLSPETVIKTLASSLNASSDCKVQGLDVVSWYGPAKQAREDCQSTSKVYRQLQVSVDDMRALSVYMAAMVGALQPALEAPSSGEFAIISDYSESWNKAYDTLVALNAPEKIRAEHAKVVEKTVGVRDSWQALSDANGSRDRDAFTSAEKSLNDRYAELRTVADGLNASILTIQKSINSAVATLSE